MKLRNIAFMFLGAVLCACQADTTEDVVIAPKGTTLTAYASIEEQNRSVATNDGLNMAFAAGDQVGVYIASDKNTPIEAAEDNDRIVFTGTLASVLSGGETICGYYPYNAGIVASGNVVELTVPAVQLQAEADDFAHLTQYYALAAKPAEVSVSGNEASASLDFAGVFSLVRIKVVNDTEAAVTVKRATLAANAEGKYLTGTYGVDLTVDPSLTNADYATSRLSSDENDGSVTVSLGTAAEVAAGETIYLHAVVNAVDGLTAPVVSVSDGTNLYTVTKSIETGAATPRDRRSTFTINLASAETSADNTLFISTADELTAFATAVNGGDTFAGKSVKLLADIDLGGAEWTPIGNGTFGGTEPAGNMFCGTFDGQGHTVDNFVINNSALAAKGVAALFGNIKNATVKSVVVGAKASVYAKSATNADGIISVAGIVAAAYDSTVEGCTNNASVKGETGIANKRVVVGGIVASAYNKTSDVYIKNCVNNGTISSVNTLSTNNGGNGVNLGGIVGFADANSSSTCNNYITSCDNHGTVDAQATRTAGIAGCLNGRTTVSGCKNYGAVSCNDTTASNCRVAGIASLIQGDSKIDTSINYGDVAFSVAGSTKGYAAGIVGQVNTNGSSVTGCENYGTILSDIIKLEAATQRLIAIIVANNNNKTCAIKNNKVGGKIGPYSEDDTHKVVTINDGNFSDYIYSNQGSTAPTLSNNIYAGPATSNGNGIKSVADLLAFRNAVNAGASLDTWAESDGTVNLLADLDMSSAGEWTPIGAGAVSVNGNLKSISVAEGTNAFTGIFDGNGHTLYNFNAVNNDATANGAFGLFGVVNGGAICNLNIGKSSNDASSLTVETAAQCYSGVIAGVVINGNIYNCKSYASMNYDSAANTANRAAMGLVGVLYANTTDGASISDTTNYGAVSGNGGNTASGLGGIQIGGIAGILSAPESGTTTQVKIDNCTNRGNISTNAGRVGGIVGTANTTGVGSTLLNKCTNYGDHTSNAASEAHLGNIVGAAYNVTGTGCINYADLTTTATGSVTSGGIVGYCVNANNPCSFSNCSNYGTIISARETKTRGSLWGNANGSTWNNCIAAGNVGLYNGGDYTYDSYAEADQKNYLGYNSANQTVGDDVKCHIVDHNDAGAKLRILCIGNSFTQDAVWLFSHIVNAEGITDVRIVDVYYGGRLLSEYNNGYYSKVDCECFVKKSSEAGYTRVYNQRLADMLETEEWDIITIQEHTGNKVAWTWNSTSESTLRSLIGKIKASQGSNASNIDFKYLMSQAYHNMDKIATASQPYMTFSTTAEMYNVIVNYTRDGLLPAMSDIFTEDDILVTGTVLENLRASAPDLDTSGQAFSRDGYHMNYGISRYAAGLYMYEKLVKPHSGIEITTRKYNYANNSDTSVGKAIPVNAANPDNFDIALAAARAAITTPWAATDTNK